MPAPLSIYSWSLTLDVAVQNPIPQIPNGFYYHSKLPEDTFIPRQTIVWTFENNKLTVYCGVGLAIKDFITQIKAIHATLPTPAPHWKLETTSKKVKLPKEVEAYLKQQAEVPGLSSHVKVPQTPSQNAAPQASAPRPKVTILDQPLTPLPLPPGKWKQSNEIQSITTRIQKAIDTLNREMKPIFSFELCGHRFTLQVPFYARKLAKRNGLAEIKAALDNSTSTSTSVRATIDKESKKEPFMLGFFSHRTHDLVRDLQTVLNTAP